MINYTHIVYKGIYKINIIYIYIIDLHKENIWRLESNYFKTEGNSSFFEKKKIN